jgi:hypothetical protein
MLLRMAEAWLLVATIWPKKIWQNVTGIPTEPIDFMTQGPGSPFSTACQATPGRLARSAMPPQASPKTCDSDNRNYRAPHDERGSRRG